MHRGEGQGSFAEALLVGGGNARLDVAAVGRARRHDPHRHADPGTLIDSTVIDAAAEPRRQPGGGRSKADPDARRVGHAYARARFGYKLHVAVDLGSGIARRAIVTSANVADVDKGHELVVGDERAVYADKGYVGPRLRERLAQGGIRNRVQRKAVRGHPLTTRPPRAGPGAGVLIGRRCGRVDAVFGALERSYGLARMRFMGLARNTAAALLTLTAWNLARAAG